MSRQVFKFESRWKEELWCFGPGGEFVLEHPMGKLSVLLPTETAWAKNSPQWAVNLWPTLKTELESWCKEHKVEFYIDESAEVM